MKKRSLLLVLTFVLVFVLVLATACDNHQHTWGDWQLTTDPTETATGVAQRTCECGESEIKNDVPALSDAATWTKTETPATHTEDGSAVYTSVYGTVTITLPKGEGAHAYTWTIATNPTLETVGSATGVCACGDSTTVELAVLSDTSVWTKDDSSYEAGCVSNGKDVYTSVYGTVEVVIPATGAHSWGEWTLTTAPTMETVGVATRQCTLCENSSDIKNDVAVLSDASVWTKVADECVAASCTVSGKDVYTSVYGKAEVTVVAAGHIAADVLSSDATGHWHACTVCGEAADEKVAHDIDGVRGICSVCGYIKTNHAGTESDPYDVADALLVTGTLEVTTDPKNPIISGKVWVTGVVKANASYNTKYNNFNSFVILDGSDSAVEITVYRSWGEASNTPYAGDTVIVAGYLENYNGTKEITYSENVAGNVTFEIVSRGAATVVAEADHATVALSANSGKNGDAFTFTVAADNGYEVVSVKVNGADVEAVDGTYSATMISETKVVVTTKESGSSVVEPVLAATLEMVEANGTLEGKLLTFAANGITVTNTTTANQLYADPARFYKNSTYTISYTENIAKIVITTDSGKYAINDKDAIVGGTLSVDGTIATVIVDENTNSVTLTATTNQVRVYKIEIYVEGGEVHQHEWSDWSIVKVASCSAEGLKERVCECGEKDTEVIAKLAHTVVVDAAKAATCTATGLTEGSHCSVCGEIIVAQEVVEKLEHSWSEWTVLTHATCSRTGLQVRDCSVCHANDSQIIDKLEHSWGADTVVSATCVTEGYTSHRCTSCGTSESFDIVEALGHAWTMTTEPTLTESGSAKCTRCGRVETVAPLTDTSVWTATVIQEKTYNVPEISTFTAVYGEITTVSAAKLVAPYDSKTYSSVNIGIDDTGRISKWAGWSHALLVVDAYGIGSGDAYPFRGEFKFETVDATTGEIKITQTGLDGSVTVMTAWIDWATGIIVMPVNGLWSEVNVAIPVPADTEVEIGKDVLSADAFAACTFAGQMAITYTDGDLTENIFVGLRRAYLGVTFEADQDVTTDALTTSNLITISDANEVIAVYAKDLQGAFVVADGLQGTYAGNMGELKLSGSGIAVLDGVSGTYVANDDVIGAYVGGSYYEIVLNGSDYTGVKPMVTVVLDNKGITPDESFESTLVVNKNIAITLPMLTTETKQIKGWFTDADCTQAVDNNYMPTADVTLHALWTDKVVIHLVGVNDGDKSTLYLCEGDVIGNYLPKYTLADFQSAGTLTLNTAGTKYFAGWFMDEEWEMAVPEDAAVVAEDTGLTIYAKWNDLGSYTVRNDAYTFVYDKDNEWWASNNQGKHSTSASIYIKATDTPVVIDVTYWISSEKGWDYLQAQKSSYNGKIFGALINTKGSNYTQAEAVTVRYILTADAELKLSYGKDSGGNSGSDTAWLILNVNGEVFCGVKDGLQGTYTCDGADDVVIDGLADFTMGDSGRIAYEVVSNDNGVAVVGFYADNNTIYKEIVLDLANSTYAITVPTVDVVFETAHGTTGLENETATTNKNIGIELPTDLVAEGYIFRGWYTDSDCTVAVQLTNGKFVATTDVTMYAKWDAAVTVSYNYQNGSANADVTGKYFNDKLGSVLEIGDVTNGNNVFVAWYTMDGTDGNWGEEVTANLVLSADLAVDGVITLYARWVDPFSMMGTYYGYNFYNNGSNGTVSGSVKNQAAATLGNSLTITATGAVSGYGVSGAQIAQEYANVTDGVIYLGTGYYAYYNSVGIVWYAWNKNASSVGRDTRLVFDSNKISNVEVSKCLRYNDMAIGWATLTLVDGSTVNVLLYNSIVYANVTWDADVTASDATDKNFTTYAADGSALLVKTGNAVAVPDATRGTYTNVADENVTVFLNGVGGIVVDGTTYALETVDAASNKYGATTADGYAEYIFDFENKTYSVVQPTVEISFVTAHGAADSVVVNKNSSIELPALTADGFILRGWYTDEACTTAVKLSAGMYIATDTATLYAKWDAAVSVVWNYLVEGVDNSVESKYFNDKVDSLKEMGSITNGDKVFVAWFTKDGSTDGDWGTKVSTTTVLSEDMAVDGAITLYAQWITPAVMAGEYKGWNMDDAKEAGTKPIGSQTYKVTVTVLGAYSGSQLTAGTMSVADMAVTDGMVQFSKPVYVNKEAGMLWYLYGSAGNDTDIVFDTSKVASVLYSGMKGKNGTDSYVAWLTLTMVDGSTMNVFCYERKIYDNVTWTEGVTADVANISQIAVYDKNGDLIVIHTTDDHFISYDGYQDITYAGVLNGGISTVATLDGAGTITLDGGTYTYTIIDASANKILVAMGNKHVYLTLDKVAATFTHVADGYQGTYTLPEGGTITLDGFGSAGDGKTYIVNGNNIAIYDGDDKTSYGLDIANGALLGKSAFAGLTYRHGTDNQQTITFEDSSEIKGKMVVGFSGWYAYFTGELNGDTLTLTVTAQQGSGAKVGDTIVFTVSEGKLTVVSHPFNTNSIDVANGWVYAVVA